MPTFKVEVSDCIGGWIPCVREDKYDGTNDAVLNEPAEFPTVIEADQFIVDLRGLMHMGGEGEVFRVVEIA